ncbi:hypothetical protein PR001_g33874, partial [Phytophthora rubi]
MVQFRAVVLGFVLVFFLSRWSSFIVQRDRPSEHIGDRDAGSYQALFHTRDDRGRWRELLQLGVESDEVRCEDAENLDTYVETLPVETCAGAEEQDLKATKALPTCMIKRRDANHR